MPETKQGAALQLSSIDENKDDVVVPVPSLAPRKPLPDLLTGDREEYIKVGIPLYEASIKGDWKVAKAILDAKPELVRYSITENHETALHIAASADKSKRMQDFVKNLVGMMDTTDLELQNNSSNTALCLAAAAGNVEMVKILVKRNRALLVIAGSQQMMPLYMAALFGQHDTVEYLYSESKGLSDDGWTFQNRGWLLQKCVEANLFGTALQIVNDHPELATNTSVLGLLAKKPEAFSVTTSNIVRKIYNWAFACRSKPVPPKKDGEALQLLRIIWTAWAYKPRTITLLFIGACFLIWASGALDPEGSSSADIVTSVKRGIWAMIAVFLTYCLLQAPSTLLIRPHPAIWRLVHGMAVIYLVALTFLLFQTRDNARQFMKYLHPDLGVELPERSYGGDCRLYVPENPTSRFINVYETLFDEFVLAHIFGWWGKAIMIRNQPLLWVLSIGFELMELTFRHMLPNFNECWWDSIVLDILICNWFGIWAGMHTVRYFDGKTYEWVGISRQPNILGKVKRTLSQFTPAHWDKDEWNPLLGPWRFIQVFSLCVVFLTVELNTFFLKFCLWVPPRNPIIVYRLVLWWLIAIPTIREYNSYLQDRKPVKKVGAFCWLSLAICIIELLICIKFGHGLFPAPMPRWLVILWTSAGISFLLFLILWTWQSHRTRRRKRE